MADVKKKRLKMWLLIILGVIVLGVGAFFIVKAIQGDGSSFKEYNTEQSADGVVVKLNTVERLPMTDEECQERVTVLTSSDDSYDCVIANVTVTNNTDKPYDYSYRNFGYYSSQTPDKIRGTAITLISFEGVDVAEEIPAGENHSQEVHLTIRKDVNLEDLEIAYKVNPKAEDGGAIIKLPL